MVAALALPFSIPASGPTTITLMVCSGYRGLAARLIWSPAIPGWRFLKTCSGYLYPSFSAMRTLTDMVHTLLVLRPDVPIRAVHRADLWVLLRMPICLMSACSMDAGLGR